MTNQASLTAKSKVVWITGASSGVGYETALAFARRRDRVAASARRVDRLDELVAAAKGLPGEIMLCAGDVTSAEDMQRIAEVGGMREHLQQIAHCIYQNVAFATMGN